MPGIGRTARAEEGFTLVELMVTIFAGIVVLSAILTMLDATLHQTTRTFSKVDASQSGRTATEQIETELHSACVGSGVAPIQAASDGSNLIFVSQYGSTASAANAPVPTPVEHKIVYSSANGTLVDYTYAITGGSAPNWTFSSTASSTRTLLSHVSANGSTPVFQYFAYGEPMNGSTPYTDAAGNPYMMIEDGVNYLPGSTTVQPAAAPLSVPLVSTDAVTTSEVLVNLVASASGGTGVETGLSNVGSTVQDQIVLRLTPPANHAGDGALFVPCA